VVSRNGVQFFGDPVAAFTNLARALRPGGTLVLQVWQGYDEQDWLPSFRSAVGAPPLHGVGPFAFGDPDRVREILHAAGFGEPSFAGLREPMWFGADVEAASAMVMGLVGGLVDGPAAAERLRADLAAHAGADGVTYASAMWLVTATIPS
jgi:SAM-dependent methyltransferase